MVRKATRLAEGGLISSTGTLTKGGVLPVPPLAGAPLCAGVAALSFDLGDLQEAIAAKTTADSKKKRNNFIKKIRRRIPVAPGGGRTR